MQNEIKPILEYLYSKFGIDFTFYLPEIIFNQISKRLVKTGISSLYEYENYIKNNSNELDYLLDSLMLNVSGFFRNPLVFEYIAHRILPAVIKEKISSDNHSLRIWSTGCSNGEEPYSIAIIVHELMQKEKIDFYNYIFATDIDDSALDQARKGVYFFEAVKNVKYGLIKKYFVKDHELYRLKSEIKNIVSFSHYDMLDKRTYSPPESIFGNFDIVCCRNLLIYFQKEYHHIIFEKIYHALAKNAYLILGEAESPPPEYEKRFKKIFDRHIYRKV
ncbi:MAG: protein-glutamate O-methyltransferase CheR [Desulfobacterales bacterium]|nr:protein-glutamate O-methyltransferase CheR [Desulfobacterales bacterium]